MRTKKKADDSRLSRNKILAVTYFHMGRPHTIIGDTPFHC